MGAAGVLNPLSVVKRPEHPYRAIELRKLQRTDETAVALKKDSGRRAAGVLVLEGDEPVEGWLLVALAGSGIVGRTGALGGSAASPHVSIIAVIGTDARQLGVRSGNIHIEGASYLSHPISCSG